MVHDGPGVPKVGVEMPRLGFSIQQRFHYFLSLHVLFPPNVRGQLVDGTLHFGHKVVRALSPRKWPRVAGEQHGVVV